MAKKDKRPVEVVAEDADDKAAEVLDSAVRNTPWWALSLGFHALILFGVLPVIVFSRTILAAPDDPIVFKIHKPDQRLKEITPTDLRANRASPGELSSDPVDDNVPPIPPPFDAVFDDHPESNNGIDQHTRRGDLTGTSWEDLGDTISNGRKPGAGNGNNIAMGVGDGSGGPGKPWGNGLGGRADRYTRWRKGHPGTGAAVEEGLRWLARHQSPDGHWSSEGFHAQCAPGSKCRGEGYGDFDAGNTGLAVLGFLGAGYTSQNRASYIDPVTKKTMRFGETVRLGVRWLIEHQNQDGCIGPQCGEMMYNHAIATLALCEAYGLTNAVAYRAPAQKALNFLVMAQNYGLGWRYMPKCGQNDTSVTGWCVMALKSAQISGFDVPRTSFDGARAWLDRVTDSNGQVGYDRLGSGEIYVPGKNEEWQHHPSMTAVGVLCRIFIDKKKGDRVLADGAKIILSDLPKWDPGAKRPTVDFYYWYYATLALYQLDGHEGTRWKQWNGVMTDILCKHQRTHKDGCADGSWDVERIDRWAHAGGRVYGTAINVLTLETVFRYESLFGGDNRGGK